MNVLDLFSGIGGFSLGLERAGMTTVAFCEIEPFCQKVLRKHWPGVPIYEDVRTLTAERLRTDGIDRVDLICGGFPCQPFSSAGEQRGKEDDRHLWPEMFRLVQECQPAWVIGENVAGFVGMALDEMLLDLETAGYEVQPFIIPVGAINADHRRDRVWILAHCQSIGLQGGNRTGCNDESGGKRFFSEFAGICGEFGGWWCDKPRMARVVHGISAGMDRGARVKALGDTVIPQIPEIIGRAIMEIEKNQVTASLK